MIKQEISPKKNTSTVSFNSVCVGQNEQCNQRNLLSFTEIEFMEWCRPIPTKELVYHFKIFYPEAVRYFRNNFFQYKEKLAFQIDDLTHVNHTCRKMAADSYFQFSQALLLTSDKQYLDSISLNPQILICPKKTYKLLVNMKNSSWMLNKKQQIQRQHEVKQQKVIKNPQIQVKKIKTLQILEKIAGKIQKNLSEKMKLNFKIKFLFKSDTLLSQFNFYWRDYSEEEKNSIWFLGYNDIKKAASKFLNRYYKVDFFKIQQYVYEAKKLSNKQINGSVFSWKLNEQSRGITQYMQLIFKQIKQRLQKRSRQYVKLKPKNRKKKKIKERVPRRDTLDESSNETNQTDIIYQNAFDININEIIQTKIEKDIVNLADDINQEANLYFDNKELGYERLRHIFANINVSIKLYGSCCVGLAIKNSDIDVAIEQSVLNQYCPYLIDTCDKISVFFEYIQCYFANYPWISNIKIIKSATIPIIKFTIDNRIQFNSPLEYGYQVHQFLNKRIQNPGLVQIDLTIQTTESSRRHLGIISTIQTQAWLKQISTLQAVCIILKRQLADKNLNETYYGGLNTYTLLILIIAVVRRQKLEKQSKVSVVMQKFLKFYCQQFDEQKFGIDLNLKSILYLKPVQKMVAQVQLHKVSLQNKKRQLQVKDAMNPQRITTRNCYQFRIIKKIFSQLYQCYFKQTRTRIQQLCSIWNPKQNPFDQEMLMDWVQRQIEEKKLMRIQKIQ